jgi:predicted Ser/Thr protein kinase
LAIKKKLREGSFGVVYKAKWKEAYCMIKSLKSGFNDEGKFIKEMKNIL